MAAWPALATTVYEVDSTLDEIDANPGDQICAAASGHCTLRAAVMETAVTYDDSRVEIRLPAGTFTLTRDDGLRLGTLFSSLWVDIVHEGPGTAVLDGHGRQRILDVPPQIGLDLQNVTLRNGFVDAGYGAAVRNFGVLRASNCVFEDNVIGQGGGGGGAIWNAGGEVLLYDTTIRNNRADFGGGLLNTDDAMLLAYRTTFSGNVATRNGGAIHNEPGGVYLNASTVSTNVANDFGAGIYNAAKGTVFVYSTSIVGNDADHDRDETVGGAGGGVYNAPGGRFGLVNSLLAWNTLGNLPVESDCSGHVESYGTNLLGAIGACDTTDTPLGLVSLASVDPVLRDNGGWVATHALRPGSEAIDSTTDALACVDYSGQTMAVDARGAPRIAGTRCDVGAYEFGAEPVAIDALFFDGFD